MIYIVTDSNYLNVSYSSSADFTSFYLNSNFHKLISLKGNGECVDTCEVCLPEMVFLELIQHKNEAYKKVYDTIEKYSLQMKELMLYEMKMTPQEYEDASRQMADKYISEYHITKIPLCKNQALESIIIDALHKYPPFEGIRGKSDKGFKDAVIWYSTMEFAKENCGDYLFVSEDSIFNNNKKYLADRFKEETGCQMQFCRNFLEVQQKVLKQNRTQKVDTVSIKINEKQWEFWNERKIDLQVSWTQPYIEENGIESLQYINNDISAIYEATLMEWKKWHYENIDSDDMDNIFMELHSDGLGFEILLNQSGILCIRFDRYIYRGGAHGLPVREVKIYDLNTGEKLGLRDFVEGTDQEIFELVERRLEEEKVLHNSFDRRPFICPDFTLAYYKSVDEFKFYVDPEGVHIYFDVYEASSYSEGFIEFLIAEKIYRNINGKRVKVELKEQEVINYSVH